jgi:hypothetical protein
MWILSGCSALCIRREKRSLCRRGDSWGWQGWQGSYDYAGFPNTRLSHRSGLRRELLRRPAGAVSAVVCGKRAHIRVSLVPMDKIVQGLPFTDGFGRTPAGFRMGMG